MQGRVVSFRHSLVVMTSNVGSAAITGGSGGRVGFQLPAAGEAAEDAAYGVIRDLVTDELKVSSASSVHISRAYVCIRKEQRRQCPRQSSVMSRRALGQFCGAAFAHQCPGGDVLQLFTRRHRRQLAPGLGCAALAKPCKHLQQQPCIELPRPGIQTLNPVLQAYFRPELLNRLDEVLVFRSLDRPAVCAVAGLLVAETAARLLEGERNIRLTVAPSLLDHICAAGYDQVCLPPLDNLYDYTPVSHKALPLQLHISNTSCSFWLNLKMLPGLMRRVCAAAWKASHTLFGTPSASHPHLRMRRPPASGGLPVGCATRRLDTRNPDNGQSSRLLPQEYGARPLRRAVAGTLEDALADALLRDTLQPGDSVLCKLSAAAAAAAAAGRPPIMGPSAVRNAASVNYQNVRKQCGAVQWKLGNGQRCNRTHSPMVSRGRRSSYAAWQQSM